MSYYTDYFPMLTSKLSMKTQVNIFIRADKSYKRDTKGPWYEPLNYILYANYLCKLLKF